MNNHPNKSQKSATGAGAKSEGGHRSGQRPKTRRISGLSEAAIAAMYQGRAPQPAIV